MKPPRIHKDRKLKSPMAGLLPIYGANCSFKTISLYDVHINYPASVSLLTRIKAVSGVDSLAAVQPHVFRVGIARMFKHEDVKRRVNLAYKAFIKEMQSLECSTQPEALLPTHYYEGLTLPNGKDVSITDDTVTNEIAKNIRNSKINKRKDDNV